MDSEASRYCRCIASFSAAPVQFAPGAAIDTLHRALLVIMRYARILLENAAGEVTEVPGYFSAWRKERDHPFEVFKGAEQIVYGAYSGMTHADSAPYAPVAVLRTAIELRLRHAFCIYTWVSSNNPEDTTPIDMSSIFWRYRPRKARSHSRWTCTIYGASTAGATTTYMADFDTFRGWRAFYFNTFDLSLPVLTMSPTGNGALTAGFNYPGTPGARSGQRWPQVGRNQVSGPEWPMHGRPYSQAKRRGHLSFRHSTRNQPTACSSTENIHRG